MGLKSLQLVVAATILLTAVNAKAHEKEKKDKKTVVSSTAPLIPAGSLGGIPHTVVRKQGFDIRLYVSNFGVIGKAGLTNPPPESLGCEFPAGSDIEHLYGGGVWVGGIIDTSHTGVPAPTTAVTTAYEGWAGPLEEMFPSADLNDDIWTATTSNPVKPAGWDSYWGSSLPFKPISDQDFYCTYSDTLNPDFPIAGHVPLGIKVIQKSFAWAGGYADAIIPLELAIINIGAKVVNQAYIGYFMDMDLGPYYILNPPYSHNFFQVDYAAYYRKLRTAYINNPVDRGSTPLGLTLVNTPKPLDSLTYTFRWYPGGESPANDQGRYQWLSSGVLMPDQSLSDLSDTRFLFGFGPFTIQPKDTLRIAVAVVSGNDLAALQENASRALTLYQRGYRVPITPPSPPLRYSIGFKSVRLDWQWRPGIDPGVNPELVVDDSNKVARADTARKGKIFEGYRLYRSENPGGGVASYTLLEQVDVPDQFEFNTGLSYTFVDSNLVRGKIYWYAVTSFSIPDISVVTVKNPDGTFETDTTFTTPLESSVLSNAVQINLPFEPSTKLGGVLAVPNPYRTNADYTFENGGWEGRTVNWDETKRVIRFIHLPAECTIRIFTMAGELVSTIEHRPGVFGYDPNNGQEDWHLLSASNRALASGVYIFAVDSNFGTQVGKFVIIK